MMDNEKRPVKAVVKADKLNAVKPKSGNAKPVQKKGRKFDLIKSVVAVGRFFREVVSELKKVVWPSRKEFVSYTIAVVVFVSVFGVVIYLMDIPLAWGVSLLSGIGK